MLRAVLFGASGGGNRLYPEISKKYEVVAFVDNDMRKWGKRLHGHDIYDPDMLMTGLEYDVLIITSAPGLESIRTQCVTMGVREERIITSYVEAPLESRRIFLENFASMIRDSDPDAECAEAGVFEGDFARWINYYFPARKLHLFDTFEGFDDRDVKEEKGFSEARTGDYGNTSVEKVLDKMPYPDNCVIHKGYFPETACEVSSKFCFVNLDLDLYAPTYKGLVFFSTRMSPDGIILVHDYFADNFKGPKKAVDRFIMERHDKVKKYPIGDGISIMLAFDRNF